MHGWIRWSEAEQRPVLVDSHGQSVPAWPNDVLDINMKVLGWYRNYYAEQRAVSSTPTVALVLLVVVLVVIGVGSAISWGIAWCFGCRS